jgi:Zn-dependent protease with chaperone function
MFPILEILVAFVLGLTHLERGVPKEGPVWVGVVALQIAGALLALGAGALTLRRLRAGSVEGAAATHAWAFLVTRVACLGLFGVQVWLFGWPDLAHRLGLRSWILVDVLVALLPYALHLVTIWTISYRAERRFRFSRWSSAGYVVFQTRQLLLPLLPLLSLIAIRDALELLAGYVPAVERYHLWLEHLVPVQWATIIGLFVLVTLIAPLLFKLLWRMRPLPDGPLRRRLEAFGARVGFRARDILLWPTSGNVLNAAIIGILPRLRYVMLTDGLIGALSEDEIEAVYAHEVGHAKHHHMILFLLFAIAFLFLMHLFFLSLPDGFEVSTLGMLAILVGLIVLWWGGVFGWISRRLERQADVYGTLATAEAHGDADGSAFISALENLAEESGQIRHLPGLRHFSIHDRADYLRRFLADEGVRRRYRRSIRLLFVVFLGLFGLVTVAAASTVPLHWELGRALIAREDGDRLRALEILSRLPAAPGREEVLLHVLASFHDTRAGETERALELLAGMDRTRRPEWAIYGLHSHGYRGPLDTLARTKRDRGRLLRAAATMRSLLDREPQVDRHRLGLAWLLVAAAEADFERGVDLRLAQDAVPLLVEVTRGEGESPSERDLRAEAWQLLGRVAALEADAEDGVPGGGPSAGWRAAMRRAWARLATAESLEAFPPDQDQLALRGDLLAREGLVVEAIDRYREAVGRGLPIRDERGLLLRPVPAHRRAEIARHLAGRRQDRPLYRLLTAELLLEATRDLLRRSPLTPPAVVRAAEWLEAAGPPLGRLARPEPGDPPVPAEIRAAAERALELHAALAAPPRGMLRGANEPDW